MRRIPVLDRSRVTKAPGTGRTLEWRVSLQTYTRFRDLLDQLVGLEYQDQTDPAVRDKMESLREDIRHLPGYPREYDKHRDIIEPVITTASR